MSKAVRKKARKARSEAQRQALYMETATEMCEWLNGRDLEYEEAHMIVYNLLDSIEKRMLQLGYRPDTLPTYKRRLGGQTRADAGNFTLCKRCTCTEQDEDGAWFCSVFHVGPDKERYYVADGDGCARGIPRREYR